MAEQSRQKQLDSTKLLSMFLEAEDLRGTVQAHVDMLQEDFFIISSTYMEMAKKEDNKEIVAQLEAVLKVAMEEKEKTLRPEIRLLNQLLRDKSPSERLTTMAGYNEFVIPDGYFFSLLNRMLVDVEGARKPQEKLLSQLRMIKREAEEQAKSRVPK